MIIPIELDWLCEEDNLSKNEILDLMSSKIISKKTFEWNIYFISYPNLQNNQKFIKDFKNNKIIEKPKLEKIKIIINSLNDYLFKNFINKKYFNEPILDDEWFYEINNYIRSLSLKEKMTIVSFTNQSHNHIQKLLLKEDLERFYNKIRNWKKNLKINGYLILFFPLLEILGMDFENDLDIKYSCILNLLPELSNEIINEALIILIKDMNNIINQSPKTNNNFYLFRGIKNDFISSKNFKNYGFTSCSLNPFHVLKYMSAGECCIQRILIPKGSKLLFVGGLSVYKKEFEFLLLNNSKFEIINFKNLLIPTTIKYKNKYCPLKTKNIKIYNMKLIS